MKTKLLSVLLFILVCFQAVQAQKFSTKGTDFIMAFMPNSHPPQLTLFFSSDEACAVTVNLPGRPPRLVNLAANSPGSVDVTAEYGSTAAQTPVYTLSTESNSINNKSIRISATKPISVYAFNSYSLSTDASLILPTATLDDEYRVLSSPNNATYPNGSQFSVVSLANNTVVEITPTGTILLGTPRPASVPFTVTLNANQVYFAQSNGDLTGTKIRVISSGGGSCGKVAVFSGTMRTNLPNNVGSGFDHLYEQMMPISSWGKNFIVPFLATANNIIVRIIPTNSSIPTTITSSLAPGTFTIPANTPFFQIPTNITTSISLSTSQPVSVGLYSLSMSTSYTANVGDPFLMLIPPIEQRIDRISFNAFIPNSGNWANNLYTAIIAPTAEFANTKLDGVNLSAIVATKSNAASFTIDGVNYTSANFRVTAGNHNLVAPPNGKFISIILISKCLSTEQKMILLFVRVDKLPSKDFQQILREFNRGNGFFMMVKLLKMLQMKLL
jgi:hypothetical protein